MIFPDESAMFISMIAGESANIFTSTVGMSRSVDTTLFQSLLGLR